VNVTEYASPVETTLIRIADYNSPLRLKLTGGHDCCSETEAGHKPEFAVQLLLVAQVLEHPRVILVGLLIRGYLSALAMAHFVLVHFANVPGLAPEECETKSPNARSRLRTRLDGV
jgi:hypothetical protein